MTATVPDEGVHYRQGGVCHRTMLQNVIGDGSGLRGVLFPQGSGTSITRQWRGTEPFPDDTWHYAGECSAPPQEVS